MTDETPQSEGEPSPAVPDETPTAETTPFTYDDAVTAAGNEDDVAPAAAAPTAATPAPDPDAPVTPAADRPAGIFVPKWVGLVAAAIIAALVFGGIGYAIGDSSSDSGSTDNTSNTFPGAGRLPNGGQLPNRGQVPGSGNNGNGNNGNGNGSGQTTSNAGFLGVGVQAADAGVEVTDVASGSPAADAGLKAGDMITAIDGTKVTTPVALRSAVQEHSSGDEITVTYTRDGASSTAKVTLTSRPSQSN